jgi:hypothetical protein
VAEIDGSLCFAHSSCGAPHHCCYKWFLSKTFVSLIDRASFLRALWRTHDTHAQVVNSHDERQASVSEVGISRVSHDLAAERITSQETVTLDFGGGRRAADFADFAIVFHVILTGPGLQRRIPGILRQNPPRTTYTNSQHPLQHQRVLLGLHQTLLDAALARAF